MHSFLPPQLRGIRTQFGLSAVIESERLDPAPHVKRAPVQVCQFQTGETTPDMARHAEAISEFYYRKRVARNASQRRAP